MDIHYFRRQLEAKHLQQQETFKHILEKCQSRMKMALDKGYSAIYFEVPEFVIGKPVYSLNNCIEYIGTSLVRGGFVTKYYFPRVILVSWHNAAKPLDHNSKPSKHLSGKPLETMLKPCKQLPGKPLETKPAQSSEFVKRAKKNKNKKLTLDM